ncbi:MAG: peptide MFS transporter [Bacteroidaceae bacterium]|nr:peptide MFS transporter [Bacteroidaceae bacterium]
MFKGHPKGLYALALANTGERFGYYTMLAVFALFLRENFGLAAGTAGAIYSTFLGLVYFMPLVGGVLADKFGFGKMVTIGITIMFAGYMLLSFPLGGDTIAMIAMMAALVLISLGTGLFKGNLQVMVGNLYDDPKYASKRDSGFSIFYMAINVGSLFAPTTAVGIKLWAQNSLGFSSNDAYHFAFAVACVALILSILIYYVFRSTFRHVEGGKKKGEAEVIVDNLTPQETKQRVIALCLVFAVVIFFWMAFHQNGLTLTYFADEFTATKAVGLQSMVFDVWNLALIIVAVYASFSIFQSETAKGKIVSGALATAILAFLVYRASGISADTVVSVSAPIFQQFNPFYVVALTPVSMAIFGALAKSGKEPSAPRKIAYGMMVAAVGFAIMAIGSRGLNTPNEQARAIAVNNAEIIAENIYNAADDAAALKVAEKSKVDFEGKLTDENKEIFNQVYDAKFAVLSAADETAAASATETLNAIKSETKPETRTSAFWLIFTYLVLTFAELLLSPMGISFVSKVAPPKLKGLMMGGWFVATAIGNMLVAVGGFLWAGLPLWSVWTVFIVLCLLSALFMFVMMKRLESVTK